MARVTAPWSASYVPALKVERGEALTVQGADPEYPGWRWCVNTRGIGGWLPEGLVAEGRAREAFDSTELTVMGGEIVELLSEHAGWRRCRLQGGQEGWLPESCLSFDG